MRNHGAVAGSSHQDALRYVQQMSLSLFTCRVGGVLLLPLRLCCLGPGGATAQEHAPPEHAQSGAPSKPSSPGPDASKSEPLPPLPPDASVGQTITVNGSTLHYTAIVGVVPVYNRTDPEQTGNEDRVKWS